MTRALGGLVTAALVTGLLLAGTVAAQAAPDVAAADPEVTAGRDYPGDPDAEARLVAAEERRVLDIRSTLQHAVADGKLPDGPFRLTTTGIPTIVLIARDTPYSIPELSRMAPRSVEAQDDGAYLLNEHIYVAEGATLRIAATGQGLLRLSGSPDGFVTIVTDGGDLEIQGSPDLPLEVTSWDAALEAPDTVTADGRPYIRVYAGHAEFVDVKLSDLGFWSGVTGGLSLTGAVLPEGLEATVVEEVAPEDQIPGVEALGEGTETLQTLSVEEEVSDGYASALIQSVEVTGDAFGLFVTNSDRVEIRDSTFADNLVDGLVLHRDVTNSTVTGSSATGNAQDGFNLTRATSSVVFDGLVARDNGRNGITIEGRPLVDGPSATGITVASYGDNEVRNSVSSGNGRYGIEVVGGAEIILRGNEVAGNAMGIVVSAGAQAVTIEGNTIENSLSQAVALRDAGTDLRVVDNRIKGADIGIFARDAGGRIEDNRISEVGNHGIALVGETGGSVIVGNVVSGAGPSAIDVFRTNGTAVRDNDTSDWTSTKPLDVILRRIFQPLTVLWAVLIIVLVVSVIGRRPRTPGFDPFADQKPLSAFTRGVVDRDRVRGIGQTGGQLA
ncbi:right-handed parallel beta-helix repeat-containing protein [Pseudolysinimonas sp.]|uniref:right-handed parallel beta-helix repeat-containing protein n=1 Tax=Pseudolysinimonas sp. TaxID=2680009 RepID=UPI00286D469C|nr:right-handed parallel beta-helix repeat-containing protein [Pseudolysinimonas sp.]